MSGPGCLPNRTVSQGWMVHQVARASSSAEEEGCFSGRWTPPAQDHEQTTMATGPRWGVELVAACLPRCSAACRSAAGRPSTEPAVLRRTELFSAACLQRRSAACLPMSGPSPRYGFCCARKSLLPPALHPSGAPRLMTSKFCTVAGDPLGTKTNREVSLDMSNGLVNKELMINFGNGEELLQRIKYETSNMKAPSPCSGFCYARKSLLPPALHPSDAPRLMISKFCTVARDPLGTKTGYSFETQVKGEYQSSGPLFHQHTDHAVLLVLDLKSLSLSLSMQMVVLLCTLVSWVILI